MTFIYSRLGIFCLFLFCFFFFFSKRTFIHEGFQWFASQLGEDEIWDGKGKKKYDQIKQNRKKIPPKQPNTNKTTQRNTQTSYYLFVCHGSAFQNRIGFSKKKN